MNKSSAGAGRSVTWRRKRSGFLRRRSGTRPQSHAPRQEDGFSQRECENALHRDGQLHQHLARPAQRGPFDGNVWLPMSFPSQLGILQLCGTQAIQRFSSMSRRYDKGLVTAHELEPVHCADTLLGAGAHNSSPLPSLVFFPSFSLSAFLTN